MKRISKYFLCLFAVVFTAGCAEDKLGETEFDPTVYEGDKAYMTVQVTMPSVPGSRSNTVEGGGSNVGVEIGKDYENNVKRMYVVLARSTDNAFIAFGDMSDKMKQSANILDYFFKPINSLLNLTFHFCFLLSIFLPLYTKRGAIL